MRPVAIGIAESLGRCRSHKCTIPIGHPFDCCNRGYVVIEPSNRS